MGNLSFGFRGWPSGKVENVSNGSLGGQHDNGKGLIQRDMGRLHIQYIGYMKKSRRDQKGVWGKDKWESIQDSEGGWLGKATYI